MRLPCRLRSQWETRWDAQHCSISVGPILVQRVDVVELPIATSLLVLGSSALQDAIGFLAQQLCWSNAEDPRALIAIASRVKRLTMIRWVRNGDPRSVA